MKRVVFIAAACALAGSAMAADVGAFRPTENGRSLSLTFEKYKRDVTQDVADTWGGGEFEGEQEEDHILLRLTSRPTPHFGWTVGVGVSDAESSEGHVPLLGLGAHYIFYTGNTLHASAFWQVHHVREIEYENIINNVYLDPAIGGDGLGYAVSSRTESYFEYEAGFAVTKDFFMDSGGRSSLYGGIMFSLLQSDGDEEFVFYKYSGEQVTTASEDGLDFEADSLAVLFAGIDFAIPGDRFGMRLEGRFLKQASVSFSLYGDF